MTFQSRNGHLTQGHQPCPAQTSCGCHPIRTQVVGARFLLQVLWGTDVSSGEPLRGTNFTDKETEAKRNQRSAQDHMHVRKRAAAPGAHDPLASVVPADLNPTGSGRS